MEPATEIEPTADPIVEMVDKAGKLDEEIKTKTKEFKALKEEIKTAAKGKDDNGQTYAMSGNLYSASVSYTPVFKELEDIQVEIDPIDNEQGLKLVPWDVEVAHKKFTGDQDAVKELKGTIDTKLFRALFKHVPGREDRIPNIGELTKMARTDVKKHQEVKAVVLEYVEVWNADKVNFKAKE